MAPEPSAGEVGAFTATPAIAMQRAGQGELARSAQASGGRRVAFGVAPGDEPGTMSAELPLFARYPILRKRRGYLALGVRRTAVERCVGLEGASSAQLWVKRDDQSSPLYGGNKARKSEFLLGRATARGAQCVVSGGAAGSHQAQALAVFCEHLGLELDLFLWTHPPGVVLQPIREALAHRGARVHWCRTQGGLGLGLGWHWGRQTVGSYLGLSRPKGAGSGGGSELIPPGGTNCWSNLAYVNAGLELAEQVQSGQLPEPDRVYVAAGSGGTMAGLVVGLRLAGLSSQVVGVAVADPPFCTSWVIRRQANQTLQAMRRWGCAIESGVRIRAAEYRLDPNYLGRGYALSTVQAERAVARASTAGLQLDTTYTGKAFAAFLDAGSRPEAAGKVFLFVNTLSSIDQGG